MCIHWSCEQNNKTPYRIWGFVILCTCVCCFANLLMVTQLRLQKLHNGTTQNVHVVHGRWFQGPIHGLEGKRGVEKVGNNPSMVYCQPVSSCTRRIPRTYPSQGFVSPLPPRCCPNFRNQFALLFDLYWPLCGLPDIFVLAHCQFIILGASSCICMPSIWIVFLSANLELVGI